MSLPVGAFLTLLGIVLIAAGFDLSHRPWGRSKGFFALLAPLGVLVAAAGAVSLLVPDFF